MEIKEQITEEIKKYIGVFDKYDNNNNEKAKEIERTEKIYQLRKKEFEEKWDNDTFPADLVEKERNEKHINILRKKADRLKSELSAEIEEKEGELKLSISKWKNTIDERRNQLVEYAENKEKYLHEKEELTKELNSQIKGIEKMEENGVNPKDKIYLYRRDEKIPELKKRIDDIDFKLDGEKIREEYKKLGNLKNQIEKIELHDRKHILPELAEIFEINKEQPEPEKTEPVKTEPEKTEPEKTEPVKTEPVKTEPVKTEPVKTESVKTEPEKTEPEKPEPVKTEPVKTEPQKPKTEKTEPQKINPIIKKEEPYLDGEASTKIVIGRKIKALKNDKKFTISKLKDYTKFMERNGGRDFSYINSKLQRDLKIPLREYYQLEATSINNVIKYMMLQCLENELVTEDDIKTAILAIKNKDKECLNTALPIVVDKNDLSKGAFWPWNRAERDEVNKMADEYADIIEIKGEYEPNPFKRLFKHAPKMLPGRLETTKQITDGSEKSINDKMKDFHSRLQALDQQENKKQIKPESSQEQTKTKDSDQEER